MPNRDGTGPKGQGPKTGRGFGRCGNRNGDGKRFKSQFSSPTNSQYIKELEEELERVKAEQKKLEEEKTNQN